MWQNITNGALSILVVLIIFLGFPPLLKNIIIIIISLIIAVLSFYLTSKNKFINDPHEAKRESEDASLQ